MTSLDITNLKIEPKLFIRTDSFLIENINSFYDIEAREKNVTSSAKHSSVNHNSLLDIAFEDVESKNAPNELLYDSQNEDITIDKLKSKSYISQITFETTSNENTKNNSFLIKFAQEIPSNITETKATLFDHNVIDRKYLMKCTIEKEKPQSGLPNGKDLKVLYFPNIALPHVLTLEEFKYILAFVLQLNTSNIEIAAITDIKELSMINTTLSSKRKQIYDNSLLYEQTVSIGFEHYKITIKDNNDFKNNIYEEIFYTNYINIMQYIKKSLDSYAKRNIKIVSINPSISEITVSLIYVPQNNVIYESTSIDIVRLFNIHSAGNTFGKIYIQSDDVDTYLSNPRQMQYIKTSSTAINPFKGIASMYNTCSFYTSETIESGFTLHRINILKNMQIEFVFANTNKTLNYLSIKEIITKWLETNMISTLKKLKLIDCIYDLHFNYEYFIPILSNICAYINTNSTTISDIEKVTSLVNQTIPQLKFSTRTSVNISSYLFNNLSNIYKFRYQHLVHEFITSTILFSDAFPSLHLGSLNSNSMTFTVTNGSSINEFAYMFALIFGTFKKAELTNEISLKSNELNIESIRKNCTSYGKGILKILTKLDPVLFGPRKVGNKQRSFSGLCQKHKQRVVPVTEVEYAYLKNLVPDSVVNIRNQTYPEQRLYLFCPYKQYPFLNYHRFMNQMCIIRCTTKPSNKTQYNFCSQELDSKDVVVFNNRYENQTITLYNPLISKGRKCQVPEELRHVFIQYILLKIDTFNVTQYCVAMYDKHPFIIQRNVQKQDYTVYTEYNSELDYVLLLQSELNNDYFIFLNKINGKPLVFSENEVIKQFFIGNIKKTNAQYDFFNYIEKIIKTPLSEHYSKTNKNILQMLSVDFNIKFIINNKFIEGIVYENCVYLTPKLYWQFEEIIGVIPLFQAIDNVMKKTFKVPSLDKFMLKKNSQDIGVFDHIDKVYIDFRDNKAKMIRFYGQYTFIEPMDINSQIAELDLIRFDYESIIFGLYNSNLGINDKFMNTEIKKQQIGDIIQNYIFILVIENGVINEEILKKRLLEMNVIYNSETFIVYNDVKTKFFISWRNSKINEKDYDEYIKLYQNFDTENIIKTAYLKFQNDLGFKHRNNEIISSKIISI